MEFVNSSGLKPEETKAEKPKVPAVVKGGTSIKKKSNAKKFAENFIVQDMVTIKEYLIFDVILPGTKRLVSEMGHTLIDMIFYGGASEGRYRRSEGGRIRQYSRESYNRYYDDERPRSRRDVEEPDRRNRSSAGRLSRGYSAEDVEFDERWDAEEVVRKLRNTIEEFGLVSVQTYYEFCNIDSDNYMDNDYGWFDIVNPRYQLEPNGKTVLYLPKPVLIK